MDTGWRATDCLSSLQVPWNRTRHFQLAFSICCQTDDAEARGTIGLAEEGVTRSQRAIVPFICFWLFSPSTTQFLSDTSTQTTQTGGFSTPSSFRWHWKLTAAQLYLQDNRTLFTTHPSATEEISADMKLPKHGSRTIPTSRITSAGWEIFSTFCSSCGRSLWKNRWSPQW